LVSQGAPGYARLARDKETIVRAYLATPTNCTVTSRQSIAPFSATLDVTNGNTSAPPQLREYAPLSGKVSAATQIYSTADPFFVVPASYLAPTSISSFTATFTLTITYTRNGAATPYTTSPVATPKAVDQKTNALRVLVVPMGDPTSSSIQWSNAANTPTGPTAEETLQNVMANAARAFPMPTGVTPALTASSTGGIRYVPGPTLLDVKSLGLYKTDTNNVTKFCANGTNWGISQVTTGAYAGHTLKGDLLQRLADYNLLNTPPADVVVGVVDGAIAWRSADNLGCDDGRATTPASKAAGQVAWVRVSTDPAYPTPLQMELMHPFGISKTGTFHSTNVEADGAAPDHGYNVLQRKVVSTVSGALGVNDHSIMNYNTVSPNPPYTKDNTLLEPTDWAEALCDLGGVASAGGFANCTLSSALGTSQGVPATGAPKMYQISGILDTTGGVRVTDAKKVDGDVQRGIDPTGSSGLHLFLCAGPCSIASSDRKDVALALLGGEGHIGEPLESGDSFGALVTLEDGAWTCSALKLDGVGVFDACDDPTHLPNITSTSTVATGTVLADFTMPAGNGRAVAFDGNNLLYTTFVGDDRIFKFTTGGVASGTISVGVQLGALALKPDTGHLYGANYTGTGEVYDIDPNTATGDKQTLFTYDDTPETKAAVCPFGAALFQEIDGLELLPSGNLALSGDRCTRVHIKTPPAGTSVSYFDVPPGEDNAGITTDGADGLWLGLNTHPVEGPHVSRLAHRDAAGNYPPGDSISPGRFLEDLAFDAKTFAPNCVVWGNTADEYPAHVLAYAVPCPSTGTQRAVAVKTENARFVSLQFTCGTTTNPADSTPTFTLANGLRPDAGGEVVANYTNQLFCGENQGQIISTASNGWNWTGLSDSQATMTVTGTSKLPTVNIASPLNGSKVRRGEFVHYEGGASDASDGAITGAQLEWSDDKLSPSIIGTGTSFDLRLGPNSPLGDHHITLKATDASGNSATKTVTITIGPALCPSTSKCP
jgi:hypothetical protein